MCSAGRDKRVEREALYSNTPSQAFPTPELWFCEWSVKDHQLCSTLRRHHFDHNPWKNSIRALSTCCQPTCIVLNQNYVCPGWTCVKFLAFTQQQGKGRVHLFCLFNIELRREAPFRINQRTKFLRLANFSKVRRICQASEGQSCQNIFPTAPQKDKVCRGRALYRPPTACHWDVFSLV